MERRWRAPEHHLPRAPRSGFGHALLAPEGSGAGVDFARARAREVYRKWLALTRPASGELRRPIWLFRPLKPTLEAYRLPDDERTAAARTAARGECPSALELHQHVDWSPADVWGPGVGEPSRRKAVEPTE